MDLIEILDKLEEPILITGHVNPDADVISTAFSLIYYLSNHLNKKAYFTFKGELPDNLLWAMDEELVIDEKSDYNSLIVVDTSDSTLRIGFEKKDVPVLVLDHHPSSFDLESTDKVTYIAYEAVSTSSMLLDFGIKYYLIYLGIFYDSIGRNENVLSASKAILELGITEEEIQYIHSNLRKKADPKAVEIIKNSFSFNHVVEDLVLTHVIYEGSNKYYFNVLEFYSKFCDILVIYHSPSGTVNIKTSEYLFNVSNFCKKFGGGGHKLSGGFIVANEESFYFVVKSLLEELNMEPVNEA